MGSYKVCFRAGVEKDLRTIPKKTLSKIWQKIHTLATDPTPIVVKSITGEDKLLRLRQGDYRIIYRIDHDEKRVFVEKVRHRSDVYKS